MIIFEIPARRPALIDDTTEIYNQPEDEVPANPIQVESIVAPFSCLYEGTWYREREEFRSGPNGCSICLCVGGQVKCNDESCPRETTSTTTSTTTPRPTRQRPTTTTTTTTTTPIPMYDDSGVGPRGGQGNIGSRGGPGDNGVPVSVVDLNN